MKRLASLLTLAALAATTGCETQRPANYYSTGPQRPNLCSPRVATPPLIASDPSAYPTYSGLPGYGTGLAPIDPLSAINGIEIQMLPPEAQQTAPPSPDEVVRIVAPQEEAQAAAMGQSPPASVYPPAAYIQQPVPPYIPQTIYIQAPPQIIVQPEYIPYPVYEPVFVFQRRHYDGFGVEICDPDPWPRTPIFPGRPRTGGDRPSVAPIPVPRASAPLAGLSPVPPSQHLKNGASLPPVYPNSSTLPLVVKPAGNARLSPTVTPAITRSADLRPPVAPRLSPKTSEVLKKDPTVAASIATPPIETSAAKPPVKSISPAKSSVSSRSTERAGITAAPTPSLIAVPRPTLRPTAPVSLPESKLEIARTPSSPARPTAPPIPMVLSKPDATDKDSTANKGPTLNRR